MQTQRMGRVVSGAKVVTNPYTRAPPRHNIKGRGSKCRRALSTSPLPHPLLHYTMSLAAYSSRRAGTCGRLPEIWGSAANEILGGRRLALPPAAEPAPAAVRRATRRRHSGPQAPRPALQ
jgi:hypothetical protein